jgi:hypothetical protein
MLTYFNCAGAFHAYLSSAPAHLGIHAQGVTQNAVDNSSAKDKVLFP